MWSGQIVSEVGWHFNTVAVLSLTLQQTGRGSAVGAVMIARLVPMILAAPVAGLVLDRTDRRAVMVIAELCRGVTAGLLLLTIGNPNLLLLFVLNGLLYFAAPFFTSGRASILPRIVTPDELHTANTVQQTTAWLTLSGGAMLGGWMTASFGYHMAFAFDSLSFLFSAFCTARLRPSQGSFRPEVAPMQTHWKQDIREGLAYIRRTPLMVGIALGLVGWAGGGGAAQILFTLMAQQIFHRGPAGLGILWGFAGVGLVLGAVVGYQLGKRLTFHGYKHAVWIGYFIHGAAYVWFALADFLGAVVAITISRTAQGANNVQNRTMLLRHVPDALRGRVFTAMDAILNITMVASLAVASVATAKYTPRQIAFVAGVLSTLSAVPWAWLTFTGRLKEPATDQLSRCESLQR
jgi:MFS family permease